MKTYLRIILFAILLLSWSAKAAWVVGDLRDSSETNFPLLSVVITPKSTPQAVGGLTIIDVVRNLRVTNGAFGPVWLVGGNYDFDAGVGKHFKITVPPNDTNTYALNQVAAWATNLGTFSFTNFFGSISSRVWPGSGVTIVTNNPGLVTEYIVVNATGGGGAAVDDTPFASPWNGVINVAPSKNAVYDALIAATNDLSGVLVTRISNATNDVATRTTAATNDLTTTITATYIGRNAGNGTNNTFKGDAFGTNALYVSKNGVIASNALGSVTHSSGNTTNTGNHQASSFVGGTVFVAEPANVYGAGETIGFGTNNGTKYKIDATGSYIRLAGGNGSAGVRFYNTDFSDQFALVDTTGINIVDPSAYPLARGVSSSVYRGDGTLLRMPVSRQELIQYAPTPTLAYTVAWETLSDVNTLFTEAATKALADKVVSSGMLSAGWNVFMLDDGWMQSSRVSGLQAPNATRFPSGMKSLATYIKAGGLKPWIYTSFGDTTCLGFAATPYANVIADVQNYAGWGYLGVKVDACGSYVNNDHYLESMANLFGNAIINMPVETGYGTNFAGMTLLASEGVGLTYDSHFQWKPLSQVNIAEDPNSAALTLSDLYKFAVRDATNAWAIGPGHYIELAGFYADYGAWSTNLVQSWFTLNTVMASPMIVGSSNMFTGKKWVQFCTNSEVVSVHQDAAVNPFALAYSNNLTAIFQRPLGYSKSSNAVALVNLNNSVSNITTTWGMLGIPSNTVCKVRDLWGKSDFGTFTNAFTVTNVVANSGTNLYLVIPSGIVSLANGGAGSALADPGADTFFFWDNTDHAFKFGTVGSGLAYDHASHTISATGGGGTVDDTAFASSWNGVLGTAPSKNSVYDYLHILSPSDNGKAGVLDMGAGIVKTSAGGAVSAASAGSDYVAPSTTITINGTSQDLSANRTFLPTTATPQFAREGLGAAADANHLLTIASGTITTDVRPINITETRNSSGTTFKGLTYTITDTASASGSLLFQILSGASGTTTELQLSKTGNLTINGNLLANNATLTGVAANSLIGTDNGSSILPYTPSANLTVSGGTVDTIQGIQTTSTPQFARIGVGGAADATHILKITGGTVTADTHLTDEAQTWNSSGVTFTLNKWVVTDTASASGSKFLDMLVGASSKFSVNKAGDVTFAGTATGNGSGLSTLNATSLSSGTVADARLSANVPLLNAQNNYSASNYFNGAVTVVKAFNGVPSTLTDATTIATDASLGNHFRVTLGGNRTLGNPSNPTDGQRIVWELIQDGTGSRTITLGTKFAFGTDLTAVTLTTTASKRDFLTAIYNSTADKWYVVAFIKGY